MMEKLEKMVSVTVRKIGSLNLWKMRTAEFQIFTFSACKSKILKLHKKEQ